MNRYKLTSDVKEKVARYVADGIIPNSLVASILRAESNDQVIAAMCDMCRLSREKKMLLWDHVIHNVWSNEDLDCCFNELEGIFFRELVQNNGLLRRVDVSRIKLFNTDRKISITSENLRDLALIDIYRLSNYEVVYILSMKLYNEVFKQ